MYGARQKLFFYKAFEQFVACKPAGNLGSLPESSAACRESRLPAATTRVLLGQDLPACCRSFRQAAGIFGRLPKLMAVMVPKVEPGPAAGFNRRKKSSSSRQLKAAENARRGVDHQTRFAGIIGEASGDNALDRVSAVAKRLSRARVQRNNEMGEWQSKGKHQARPLLLAKQALKLLPNTMATLPDFHLLSWVRLVHKANRIQRAVSWSQLIQVLLKYLLIYFYKETQRKLLATGKVSMMAAAFLIICEAKLQR